MRGEKTVRCEKLDIRLSAVVDGTEELVGDLAEHVGTCLRCQAELARRRRLRTELSRLGPDPLISVDGLVDEILAALDDRSRGPRLDLRGRRAVYTMVVAAGAAGAAGAIVAATRARGRRLAG